MVQLNRIIEAPAYIRVERHGEPGERLKTSESDDDSGRDETREGRRRRRRSGEGVGRGARGFSEKALKRHRLFACKVPSSSFLTSSSSSTTSHSLSLLLPFTALRLVPSLAPINFIVVTSSRRIANIFPADLLVPCRRELVRERWTVTQERERERERKIEGGAEHREFPFEVIDSAHRLADKPDQPAMTFTRGNGRAGRKREKE